MHCSLESITHLSPLDQRLFIEYGFGERQTPAFGCVHHAFEYHAITQPDAKAVEHLGASISYSQLDSCANRLATQLRLMGIIPGVRVCLLMQRSIPFVVGILAVLKAGGAYVPLDGSIVTQSTLEHVLHDSNSSVVLTLEEFRHRVPASYMTLVLDGSTFQASEGDCAKPVDLSKPEDSVYIIYTSGTVYLHCFLRSRTDCVTNRDDGRAQGSGSKALQCHKPYVDLVS